MIEISDFVHHGTVEPEVVEAFRGRVPDEVIELWETYGYGSFASGFLRVINPPCTRRSWRIASARPRATASRSRSW
ncbi:GAD-like domain-containing protein [Microbacterium sp. LWH11-1.2]|uniref:GAD-like domain-containing protein n=1 Tax=Microbacterium sp. LWH11-1.2 TaxID=3135258 RepID=UPI0031394A6B